MSKIQTGLRLKSDALQVPRHQTGQLCEWLSQGGLVYLVGSRQIGKSTLAQTAVSKLRAEKKASHSATIDLEGTVEIGSGSEFQQICSKLARELGLEQDYRHWQKAAGAVGGKLLWVHFLEDFLISRLDGRIVLVLDELDALANRHRAPGSPSDGDGPHLGFNDEFLLALRSLHNAAASHEALRRLSFCLVGTRPPAWLVSNPKRTRMNIGKTLVLKDFTAEEAAGFMPHLEPVAGRPQALLDEVLAWTAGHPLFTAEVIHALEQGNRVPLRGERGAVEAIVNRLYLDDGLANHNALVDAGWRIQTDEPQAPAVRRLETYELVLERGTIDYRAAEPIHLALILDGLLGIEEVEKDRYLVPRNEIFRRVFDLDWVRAMRQGALFWPPPEAGDAPVSDELKMVRGAVAELLAEHYELLDDGVEELAGILFSFSVATRGRVRKPLRLQVYRGLAGVAVELWEQEVRALERLSGTRSATLPVLHEAGIFEHRDLAYSLTDQASRQLSDPGTLDQLRDHPGAALRELLMLAKGLMALQRQGLIHRNLWSGNIEVIEGHVDDSLSLRLARFQMSMLLGNMLRRLGETQHEPADLGDLDQAVRDFFRAQGREALACAPPERLAFLFNEPGLDSLESSAGDIYSLGMICYQLFVGPLPDDRLMAAFPEERDGKVGFSLPAFREFHREIRSRLHRKQVDKSLRELLGEMIEWTAATRPTIFAVANALQANYEIIQRSFESGTDQQFILSYMPEQMGEQFHNYSWMVHDPATEQGEEELWELLSQDLRDTTITFSERGAAPYVNRPDSRHESAKFVLLGRKATYFGQLFEDRSAAGISGIPLPQVFLITFSCEKKKSWRLSDSKLQRRLPPFKLVSYRDPLLAPQRVKEFPSWMPLLQSVTRTHRSPAQEQFERSLDWLLEVERCEQTVRQYAVLAEKGADGTGTTVLRWNRERDRERIFRSTFQTFYAEDRPDFGDFFARLSREESSQLLFDADRGGELRWAKRRDSTRVTFLRRLGTDSIQVQVEGELSARGWLRAEGEIGSLVQLFRQTEARNQLSQMPNLISQLLAPRTLQRRPGPWIGAGEGLQGNAANIIRKLLDTRPFFALQGPPGTGKTTVTARAVALALKHDRSQRILISAQSHYALDHLAQKILLELRRAGLGDVPALRIVTESSEGRVEDPDIQALLPKNRVDAVLQRLRNTRSEAGLAGHPKLQEIAGRWRKMAVSQALEIQDRLRRGANVLFATTGSATAEFLGLEGQRAVCDWAIVEEASKAWPTELAIPMVQARRWTLIGDHFQLPPFGKEKLEALLRRCLQETDPEIRQHGERFDEYMQAFELFRHLFKADANPAVDRLNLQFRMDRTIGDMISRTFYEGKLETADSAGQGGLEIRRPAGLQGQRLLWVESGPQAREHPSWSNPREVELVKQLVDGLMKNRPEPHIEQLVVLSPYRQQIEELRRALGQCANRVHTVDSFQGKEADIVIVSLVRVNRNANSRERLGFLASPNRINVMMSRARKLLVLVGSYEHFKASGILFWEKICAEVVTQGGGVVTRWHD